MRAFLALVLLSGLVTLVIGTATNRTIGFRVSHEAETMGVELTQHAETAYAFGEILAGHFTPAARIQPVPEREVQSASIR